MPRKKPFRIYGDIPELMAVPAAIRRAAMPEVVAAVVERAKELAPKGRGADSPKSIVKRIVGKVEKDGEVGHVYARAPHSHLLEFGVAPHSLAPGSGKRKWNKAKNPHGIIKIFGDPAIIRRSAQHPGSRAHPFMEPAIQGAQGEVDRILAIEGEKALQESIRKVDDFMGNLGL